MEISLISEDLRGETGRALNETEIARFKSLGAELLKKTFAAPNPSVGNIDYYDSILPYPSDQV